MAVDVARSEARTSMDGRKIEDRNHEIETCWTPVRSQDSFRRIAGKGKRSRDTGREDVAATKLSNSAETVANASKEELVLIHESEGRLKDVDATNADKEWENRVIRRVVSANLGRR